MLLLETGLIIFLLPSFFSVSFWFSGVSGIVFYFLIKYFDRKFGTKKIARPIFHYSLLIIFLLLAINYLFRSPLSNLLLNVNGQIINANVIDIYEELHEGSGYVSCIEYSYTYNNKQYTDNEDRENSFVNNFLESGKDQLQVEVLRIYPEINRLVGVKISNIRYLLLLVFQIIISIYIINIIIKINKKIYFDYKRKNDEYIK